jgi:hypothetical protein
MVARPGRGSFPPRRERRPTLSRCWSTMCFIAGAPSRRTNRAPGPSSRRSAIPPRVSLAQPLNVSAVAHPIQPLEHDGDLLPERANPRQRELLVRDRPGENPRQDLRLLASVELLGGDVDPSAEVPVTTVQDRRGQSRDVLLIAKTASMPASARSSDEGSSKSPAATSAPERRNVAAFSASGWRVMARTEWPRPRRGFARAPPCLLVAPVTRIIPGNSSFPSRSNPESTRTHIFQVI